MVADAVLWILLGMAVAFLYYGCQMTKPAPKAAEQSQEVALDQAA